MPASILMLIGFQLFGEVAQRGLHLALPGPVIGMFLLAGMLICRQRGAGPAPTAPRNPVPTSHLAYTANGLIAHMGLLFVPAGVGIMTQAGLLRQQWLPVALGLVGSTLLSLGVTGWVFHHLSRDASKGAPQKPEAATPAAVTAPDPAAASGMEPS